MSIHAKDFKLPSEPRRYKDGMFHLNLQLEHEHWQRDIADLRIELHDLIKCKRQIMQVTLTSWTCFDEQDKLRGKRTGLELDVTDWFMGLRGPIQNPKISGVSFAHAINQLPTVRTPWVKDVRMNVELVVKYAALSN